MILKDFRLRKGIPERPAVILIHGFGMTGNFWEEPEACPVLGGLASLPVFLATQPPATRTKVIATGRMATELTGMGTRLAGDGFSVVSWSQSQPLGPIAAAVEELTEVIKRVREELPGRPLWLVAHSRGGLIVRSFLQTGQTPDFVGCLTLGSPHHGTRLASFAPYLQPVGVLLRKVCKGLSREGKIAEALQRVGAFLSSAAIHELKPGSSLLSSLDKSLPSQVALFSCGGTKPALFTLYIRRGDGWRRLIFPDFLLRLIPDKKIPPELLAGAGDGLVSSASARLGAEEHRDYDVNHVQLAFDPEVYGWVKGILVGGGG